MIIEGKQMSIDEAIMKAGSKDSMCKYIIISYKGSLQSTSAVNI